MILLHTKYTSFQICGLREEDCGLDGSMGKAGNIYKEDCFIYLHIKYKNAGPCHGFGEKDFFSFSHCKSMETICYHDNQSYDVNWPKT